METLKYPIGKFIAPQPISAGQITDWILSIEDFPNALHREVESLSESDLNRTYRDGGWDIRQLVHHCADSHMNAFIRFKLALTEENPKIKPYLEDRWAKLPDTTTVSVLESLTLLKGLHARWVVLLRSLHSEDLDREYIHPELGNRISLAAAVGMYAWHGAHHLAHIKNCVY